MADTGTCGECEHWGKTRCDGGCHSGRDGKRVGVRMCMFSDHPGDEDLFVWTWEDATCPAFRRRADAAERAAKRLREEVCVTFVTKTTDEFYAHVAQIIREEIAKDKEAR